MDLRSGIGSGVLLSILVICLDATTSAQIAAPSIPGATTARGRIDGRVLLPAGQGVDRRVKLILSTLRDPGMIVYTDTGGYFRYDNLAPGTYSLEAIDDSNRYDSGLERVTINRAERVTVQVYLREKRASAEKAKGDVISAYGSDREVPAPARREYEKAKELAKGGLPQEAIQYLKEAITIFPAYLMAHNDLGVQYLKLGKLEDAADEFGAAIEIDPKAFNPRLNLGIVLIQRQRYPEAVDQLTQAVSIGQLSTSGTSVLWRGVAWRR